MKNLATAFVCLILCITAPSAWAIPSGLTGVLPVWEDAAPTDGVGVRFRFQVTDNESENLKLIFGASRLRGSGADTYLLEYNLYDRGLRYEDWVHTTWPLQGTQAYQQSSLRVAVPDYILKGKTGAKSFDTEMFPRQTYEIDGIDGLWKTDLISQRDMNHTEGRVELTRGDLVSDLSGWRADGNDLPTDIYRQWNVAVTFGERTYDMAFALPDDSARWLAPWEPINFYSEFLHSTGLFKVNYWDFGIKREGLGWEPINTWRVSHHVGSLETFGVSRTSLNDMPVITFSNDRSLHYLPTGSLIDITPVSIREPDTRYLYILGLVGLLGISWRHRTHQTKTQAD